MKNILFDLDGTLTNPAEGIVNCIVYSLEKMGGSVPEKAHLTRYIGPPLWKSFMELLRTDDKDLAHEAVLRYRERFSDVGLYENTPYSGVHETLHSLNEHGYTLYVCTSKPAVFAKRIAEHFDFAKYFKEIHGSALDGALVEKDELIAHILHTEGLMPADCAMIGDRSFDIDGALQNNVTPYGVSYGFGTPEELVRAEHIFDSPSDIGAFFTKLK
jgi:phosphoglycolate phosphatase